MRFFREDLDLRRRRLGDLERDIERLLAEHEVGRLLTTIDGIGPQTAAKLVAELGDPAAFRSAAALAAYVGAIPALRQSGKQPWDRAGLSRIGHAKLRAALWMPTLVAVRRNPWLRAYYQRLRARGKLPEVALDGRYAQTARRDLRGGEAPSSIRSRYPDHCAMKKHSTRPDGISKPARC